MDERNPIEGRSSPTDSDAPGGSSRATGPEPDAPRGIRARWAEQVGKPHPAGIRLNVGIRFLPSERDGIDHQIRGVVDVPEPPYGDDERTYLAKLLARAADLPSRKYQYAVLDWEATNGGSGVRIDWCGPILVLTDDNRIQPEDVHAAGCRTHRRRKPCQRHAAQRVGAGASRSKKCTLNGLQPLCIRLSGFS